MKWPWIILLLCTPALADVSISLPLQGYYREGRYMPVHIRIDEITTGTVRLSATGAADTVVNVSNTAVDVIVPMLVVRAPLGNLAIRVNDAQPVRYPNALYALGSRQRIIGMERADRNLAHSLFPSEYTPIALLMNPEALQSAAIAPSLDAIVSETFTCVGPFLSIETDRPLDPKLKDFKIDAPIGPIGTVVSDAAYLPTYAWNPGWPPTLRRVVIFAAFAFLALSILIALLGRRFAWAMHIVAAVIAISAILWWRAKTPPVFETHYQVISINNGTAWLDRWSYQTAAVNTRGAYRWSAPTWPVFASESQMLAAHLELHCDFVGRPTGFLYDLPRNGRIAFFTRAITRDIPAVTQPIDSALMPLIRDLYLAPGVQVLGQSVDSNVILQTSPAHSPP